MKEKPFAITLDVGSSLANHTGAWRTERPEYVHRLPPCNQACPAGENIQQWLFHAESGDYEAAWRELMRDNPLPAVMGRVCYHPCETACNRVQVDDAVGINSVERFLGDEAIRRGWSVPAPATGSGKRVLVVGSGPAGLSAAYHLRLLGHEVTVREAQERLGGMMRYGIPRYRLPREVLDAEIGRIRGLGVALETGARVADVLAAQEDGGFDAVFLAVGAGIGRRAYIPAGDSARILDAVALLGSMEGEGRPLLGRRVAVYGGGNTAMDAARTARRLGATDAVVVYRRTRDRMPAHDEEVEEALEEGVRMKWLSTIKHAAEGRLTVERMALDETGFPQPTGEFEELEADSVVLALGQESDLSLVAGVPDLTVEHGTVQVAQGLMTGHEGVFAGGDMVPAERTVTVAVGHGKKAARHIDAFLRGTPYAPGTKHPPASADRLNTWYYSDAPASVRPRLTLARRVSTFDEVVQGLDRSTALFEARRCMSCGNCFECDNCYGVCPDNAITKLGPGKGFSIDLDYCKGCGLCAAECPAGAIDMVPEE
ncbi:NAD(P)-binding protein [Streptomyces niveiscabiei]|uniref:NAD(P)-binding protein n=1 Tax=Streptomyces niveiscabiei TaxID=164115 RepID=UPI0029A7FD97|nr:NAD(P)-binding protein [Streptomyces niveiscabiei]MDX3387245.1 NAD(P)-binding protein [Streptomyces niveiscabiei]